jgi:protocatechuate 3,4-dioxygenase beta subunit
MSMYSHRMLHAYRVCLRFAVCVGIGILPTQALGQGLSNPGRKTIEGRVVNESDRPVAGALVQATPMNIGDINQGLTLETWTDGDGHFSFTDAIRGVLYVLEFRKAGFGYKTARALSGGAEEVVTVLSSEPTHDLSGRVIDSETGQGVSNARVVLIGEHVYEETALTTTEGYFLFENVPYDIGQGVIYARKDEDWSEYMLVRRNTREVVLTLDAPGRINGGVVSETSDEPVPGCTVRARPRFVSGFAVETTTGEDGTYEFENLPRGEYMVSATHPEWFQPPRRGYAFEPTEVTARSEEAVFNEIEMHRKATILGRVLGPDNRPARGAVVGVPTAFRGYGGRSFEIAESDATGCFTLYGMSSGGVEISAVAEGLGTGSVVVTELKEGEIRDGVEEDAVIKLSGVMRVFGCVKDPAGAPISRVWVSVRPSQGLFAKTDASGHFDLNWFPLPTGENEEFNVNLRAPRPHPGGIGVLISPAERKPAELPDPGTQYFLHKAVPVTASHKGEVELSAVLSPTELLYFTGQVTDSAGEPVAQANLMLFAGNVSPDRWLIEINPERRIGGIRGERTFAAVSRTVTDKDGRYTICVARESAESLSVGHFGAAVDPTLFSLGVESLDGKVKLLSDIRLLNGQKRRTVDIQLPPQSSDSGWGIWNE